MTFIQHYRSPLGGILLAADEAGLTGLWFDGEKYFADNLPARHTVGETPILAETKRWLDIYFTGREPGFLPPLHPIGSAFRQSVWELLLRIPYGQTTTYGEIAQELAAKRGLARISAQAVGGAVGHNEISILIPCHRVGQSDRVCRRDLEESKAAGAGAGGYERPLHSEERDSPLRDCHPLCGDRNRR